MRYFLDIAYVGTAFHGWQIQKNANSVQAEINNALSTILGVATECLGSGRTDTGVHSTNQIAHFDSSDKIDESYLSYRLNSLLSKEIAINSCKRVKEDAHARFDADLRSYEYHILQKKNPFRNGQAYFLSNNVDIEIINQACELLSEWKDFEAFSKVKTEVNNFNCDIHEIRWEETNEGSIFHVSANRFLRGMVRAMVGTLLEVGQSKMSLSQLVEVLESKDRRKAGRAVPPEGLYLTKVKYPEHIFI